MKKAFEKHYVEELLAYTNGNVSLASEIAGRPRSDMYRIFHQHGIIPSNFKQ